MNKNKIYKIQSKKELNEETIKKIILKGKIIKKHFWKNAYPKFKKLNKEEKLQNFRISKGIYYINAFELTGSCMETQIISTYNVINLLLKDFKKESWKIDPTYLSKLTEEL